MEDYNDFIEEIQKMLLKIEENQDLIKYLLNKYKFLREDVE